MVIPASPNAVDEGRRLVRALLSTLILLLVLSPVSGLAQQGDQMPQVPTIDDDTKAEIIDSLTRTLNEYYVFPEVAAEMEAFVRKQFREDAYKDINKLDQFTMQLTRDFRSISKDRHLGVMYDPSIADVDPTVKPSDEEIERRRQEQLEEMAYDNFDFKKLEIMAGNVGYLDLRGFNPAEFAGPTAIAAMQFLSNTDAVIIDLRQNGGGSPSMIQLISSYFFEEPTHLNSFYIRETDSIKQFWTHAFVEGKRMPETPLYVLTSDYTFSAAEEFTYNMKNLERATIVGETTGGGAHPVEGHIFPNLLVGARIPFGRAINPISGKNWEGTGVEPDIAVSAEEALDVAHLNALETLATQSDGPHPEVEWALLGLRAKTDPPSLTESERLQYVGSYGPRQITISDNVLMYEREGTDRGGMRMIPLAKDVFGFEEIGWFRLKFERDDLGDIAAVIGMYDNGRRDRNPRDN